MALAIAASPPAPNGTVYTADEAGRSISAIDVGAGTVKTLPIEIHPHNVQISTDGAMLFATGMRGEPSAGMDMGGEGSLVAIGLRPQLHVAWSMPVGKGPAHVIVDPKSGVALVTLSDENAVAVVDLSTREVVARIPVGRYPHGMRANVAWTRVYVADMHGDAVSVIDVAKRREVARIPVGKNPVQVAVDPNGRWLAATLSAENAVAVVDLATSRVVHKIAVGRNPAQVFASPDGRRIVVANQGTDERPDDRVTVIDTARMRVIATVRAGSGAHGVVIDKTGRYAFVTASFASQMSVIDLDDFRIVRSAKTGRGPNGVTFAPAR